jgi:4-hydroxybenzoate polyprenyltransferase
MGYRYMAARIWPFYRTWIVRWDFTVGNGDHTAYSIGYDTLHFNSYLPGKGALARFIGELAVLFGPGTLRLLNTGSKRAITMMARVHVAFLLAGLAADLPVYLAIGLGTYAIYTLDNVVGGVEDKINGKEFHGANKEVAILVVSMAFLGCVILMALNGLLLVPFIPIAVSFAYSRGLKLGKSRLRLKEGGYGIKNLVVGTCKGGVIGAAILILTGNQAIALLIFFFFGMKTFLVSTLNDIADMEGDAMAGIKTLPQYLGVPRLKVLLVVMTLISYALVALGFVAGALASQPFIMAYSLTASIAAIITYDPSWHYSKSWLRRNLRALLTDGEFIVPIIILSIMPI